MYNSINQSIKMCFGTIKVGKNATFTSKSTLISRTNVAVANGITTHMTSLDKNDVNLDPFGAVLQREQNHTGELGLEGGARDNHRLSCHRQHHLSRHEIEILGGKQRKWSEKTSTTKETVSPVEISEAAASANKRSTFEGAAAQDRVGTGDAAISRTRQVGPYLKYNSHFIRTKNCTGASAAAVTLRRE